MNYNEILITFVLVIISQQYSVTAISPFEWITYDKLFIDKTELIEIFLTNAANVSGNLITCPKGFGKTVNLDMIGRFFEITQSDERKAENERIFRNPRLNLRIMRQKDFVDEHYGKYPVISVNFEMTEKATTIENILEELRSKIYETFVQYQWLYGKKRKEYRTLYDKILNKTETTQDLEISLKILSTNLHKYYHKPIILLLDNCDSPLMAAVQNGIYSDIFPIFFSILENALKSDQQYALLTGISAITKYSKFRILSSVPRYYFLRRHVYSEYFGFTLKELQNFYNSSKFMPKTENELEEVLQPLFNGYQIEENTTVFPKTPIFKPASVSYYYNQRISELQQKCYLCETPAIRPEIIIKFDELLNNAILRDTIEILILKGCIRFRLRRERESTREVKALEKFFNTVEKTGPSSNPVFSPLYLYLSLLFDMGYITHSGEKGLFVIPNEEMSLHLLINLNRFLIKNIPNAEDKCAQVVKNLQIILECENTEVLEKTTTKLDAILEDMIGSLHHLNQSSERDIQSLIGTVATLYNSEQFAEVKSNVKVDKILENGTKIIAADEADLVISSPISKNLLFVDVKKRGYRSDALAKVESYRPPKSQLNSLDLLKFLLISVSKNGKVRTVTGESVFPYS